MSDLPLDQADRERFRSDWTVNLAVVANAGSGKTTAISRRLAAMALEREMSARLAKTAVVTYTKKAAKQIEQGARRELLRRISEEPGAGLESLSRLDKVFFGTIHSFCIRLARSHGSELGLHLNPTLIEEDDDDPWEAFLEQDSMQFGRLGSAQIDAFFRHASLDDIFELARGLSRKASVILAKAQVPGLPPEPPRTALEAILNATTRKGTSSANLQANKEAALDWLNRFKAQKGHLPILVPIGSAGGIGELYQALFAPLKAWLALAGGVLASELSDRYRLWRQERGIQTYDDQVETAVGIVSESAMLERIRQEAWSVLLDEAQDTDADQFSVLVEITRPPASKLGTWPGKGGEGPGPGRFCMVGDPQQGIYSSRANIQNFQRHVAAFGKGDCGECLTFSVTFRAPRGVVDLLNRSLPDAFGRGRSYNFGLPPSEGAAAPFYQVDYEPLVAGPSNEPDGAYTLEIEAPKIVGTQRKADQRLAGEARQVAAILKAKGPAGVGAKVWGDVCILAPRNDWLQVIRGEFEAAGLKTALQMRRNRKGDSPAYAWLCGLLSVLCDPDNTFEWVGVLREVFAVSDALLAEAISGKRGFTWEELTEYAGPIREALEVLRPFFGRIDAEGEELGLFASDLVRACGLADKARLADPDGGLDDDLSRLLSHASELGLSGAGPRAWLGELLGGIDDLRSAGRASDGAINMMTCHSAKGLEWPVVMPLGMWREMSRRPEHGLRLLTERGGTQRVVFDNADMGADAREARDREWKREQVRLLYVTLTRAGRALVVPWARDLMFEDDSFAMFWGFDPGTLGAIPAPADPAEGPGTGSTGAEAPVAPVRAPGAAAGPFPERVLPHQLARAPDYPRVALHESSIEDPLPLKDAVDPLDYGVWWHETLEHLRWTDADPAIATYGALRMAGAAAGGFEARGTAEWSRLLSSAPWAQMRSSRWTALAEVGIFAPLDAGRWIDGVIDLVLYDPEGKEVWIVDWKTNRQLPGESTPALLGRLAAEYEGQLRAYGTCAAGFFPGCTVRLWVYSTVAGDWTEISGVP
jgi:ATP-dependent exoDNAse (exonuclease V) beta subunit